MAGKFFHVLCTGLLIAVPGLRAEGPRWDDGALRHAGLPPFPYEAVSIVPAEAFEEPVMTIPYVAGEERWMAVLGRRGQLWSCGAEFSEATPALAFDLRKYLAAREGSGNLGLTCLGAIFDRDFPAKRALYLRFSLHGLKPAVNRLMRFEVIESAPLALGKGELLLEWESGGHDGGDLAWGPRDGYLYLSAGDGSAPGDPRNIGQETANIRGSILRLDVYRPEAGQPYRVPADNPFVGMEGVRPELWCYGLRNPWRMSFHPQSGELWLGDNGDEHWELIQRVERGANYGWSAYEGSHVFRPANVLQGPTRKLTPPVVEHPHSEMRSVIGGLFYRGKDLPALRDHYVYGCYFTKQIWAFSYRNGEVGTPFLVAQAPGAPVDFREDHEGELLVTCLQGEICRLRKRAGKNGRRPWPERLSGTRLFSDTARQVPASGVVPYRTNGRAWFDGATTERFLAVPAGAPLKQSGGRRLSKSWDFSKGTALVQTLSLGERRVETQVLYFDGQWRGYTYRWNEAGTDADLVGGKGLEAEVRAVGGEKRKWTFHARATCMTCHTQRTNFAISVNTAQLDRTGPDGRNQLDGLLADGYLANSPSLRKLRGERRIDPHDGSRPLEARARSYLDLNCAHCHRETGLGGRANFQLMSHLPLEETGVVDAKAMVGLALGPGSVLVAPGAPERSELLARMARRGPGQMPLIGSHRIDERGVALIREWILSLKPAKED